MCDCDTTYDCEETSICNRKDGTSLTMSLRQRINTKNCKKIMVGLIRSLGNWGIFVHISPRPKPLNNKVKVKLAKGPVFDIALLHDEHMLRSASQSQKWQLIGMS